MLDVQLFRDSPALVRKSLERRGLPTGPVEDVIRVDQEWRAALQELNRLRGQRNEAATEVGQAKKAGDPQRVQQVLLAMKDVARQIEALEHRVRDLDEDRRQKLLRMPNLLHESVPAGKDASQNAPVRTVGEPTKHAFEPRSHVDLLASLRLADLDRAGKVAGARFFYLTGRGVLLSLAIQRFALDYLARQGFTAVEPPYLIRREAVAGATDLHDFEDVIYHVEGEDLYLIATSEHALGAMHMGELFEDRQLPLRYAGLSPCFRKEAGAHGKDMKGLFRVHQFHKVEMFVFSRPEDSWTIHEELRGHAEALLAALELPYRLVNICTGDIGTVAAKKYDLEAWMPVQAAYRELVSCSNCTDYQARRWDIRTRPSTDAPTRFVHTLNSTALAVERTIVALLENHQRVDGSVAVPGALQPYLGGLRVLEPPAQ